MKKLFALVLFTQISSVVSMGNEDETIYPPKSPAPRRHSNAVSFIDTAHVNAQHMDYLLQALGEIFSYYSQIMAQSRNDRNWDAAAKILTHSSRLAHAVKRLPHSVVPHKNADGFTYMCRYAGILSFEIERRAEKLLEVLEINQSIIKSMPENHRIWLLNLQDITQDVISKYYSPTNCLQDLKELLENYHETQA